MMQTETRPSQEILQRDAARNSGLWQPDTVLVRGEGIFVYDADGQRYYDCVAGIAVASLGHAHPALVRAVSEQAATLMTCPQNFGNDRRAELADLLFGLVAPPLERAFFANSGTEANEAALKWARVATGRSSFVACKRGFSGRTMGTLPLTWEPKYREPFAPYSSPVDFVSYNDVEALAAAVTDETAAVLLEPIQGEGGVHEASNEFLQAARRITSDAGALLILDEIQSGAGRTGRFLASEDSGVQPDMVTMAKGLGGGVPIGALLMTGEVARAMPAGGHGTTFGGNPLSAAAACAVLRELGGGLMAHVADVGAHFKARLSELDPARIRAVRGRGLLLGLELRDKAAPVIAALKERGVLTINAGATVIRFVPPLIITRQQVDEVVDLVADALAAAGD